MLDLNQNILLDNQSELLLDSSLSKKNNDQFTLVNSEYGTDKSTNEESSVGESYRTQYSNDMINGSKCAGYCLYSTTIYGNEHDK